MNASNPTEKVLPIIPVVRTVSEDQMFLSHLEEEIKSFPNLRLTSSVLYEPSFYPLSDALQVVSDVGLVICFLFFSSQKKTQNHACHY